MADAADDDAKKTKGTLGVKYRTWDTEEYEKKAQDRAKKEEVRGRVEACVWRSRSAVPREENKGTEKTTHLGTSKPPKYLRTSSYSGIRRSST